MQFDFSSLGDLSLSVSPEAMPVPTGQLALKIAEDLKHSPKFSWLGNRPGVTFSNHTPEPFIVDRAFVQVALEHVLSLPDSLFTECNVESNWRDCVDVLDPVSSLISVLKLFGWYATPLSKGHVSIAALDGDAVTAGDFTILEALSSFLTDAPSSVVWLFTDTYSGQVHSASFALLFTAKGVFFTKDIDIDSEYVDGAGDEGFDPTWSVCFK